MNDAQDNMAQAELAAEVFTTNDAAKRCKLSPYRFRRLADHLALVPRRRSGGGAYLWTLDQVNQIVASNAICSSKDAIQYLESVGISMNRDSYTVGYVAIEARRLVESLDLRGHAYRWRDLVRIAQRLKKLIIFS